MYGTPVTESQTKHYKEVSNMANLLKIAREIILMAEDLRDRFGIYYCKGELHDFDQLWGSTALGFGGMGGSAMTWARTYVFILDENAYVYFAGMFAYTANPENERFKEDLKKHNMVSVAASGVYK